MNEVIDLSLASDDEHQVPAKLTLSFLGPPIPKPSPRARFKFNGFNRMGKPVIQTWIHNPVTTEMKEYGRVAQEQLQKQNVKQFPVFPDGPVAMKVWFCCPPPLKYFVNKDRERPKGRFLQSTIGQASPIPVCVKPDDDNLLKFLLDSLKALAWTDDNQVSTITAYKCYDPIAPYAGRTIVELEVGKGTPLPSWIK